MANTISVNATVRNEAQFQGLFNDMWTVKATISDQDAIALTTITEFDCTVPGVALGDMVIGVSSTVDLNDGTNEALMNAYVSAANTVTVQIMADEAEFAADAMNGAVVKILVARPAW
jgi:hypothetical protein